MKKKIIGILIWIFLLIGSTQICLGLNYIDNFAENLNKNSQEISTLITDTSNNRVIEVDNSGTIVWQKTGLNVPSDAERLANGNTLITEADINRVIEVDNSGTIVWQKTGLNYPSDAERLANGNTLITDTGNNRVIEVDNSGTIVWQKTGLNMPLDGERLANGNTLIVDYFNFRIIEINKDGTIVWIFNIQSNYAGDAERLANGNTLLPDRWSNRVIEINKDGTIVWQKTGLSDPNDAERLANGNTLITEDGNDRVIEVDRDGTIVWQKTGLNNPNDAERITTGPELYVTISKGLGVTANIENIGHASASEVEVTITVLGGFVLFNGIKSVFIGDIDEGVTKTAKSLPIGIGNIAIEVMVDCDEGITGYGDASGFLLFLFII